MKPYAPTTDNIPFGLYSSPECGYVLATGFAGELEAEACGELLGHVFMPYALWDAWGRALLVHAHLRPLIEGLYAEPGDTGILLKVS